MDGDAHNVDGLRRQYCPPLDEPLFISITNDHDLADSNQRKACLELLNALKDAAQNEQFDNVFDPSGTGAQPPHISDVQQLDWRSSTEESATSQGITSITTGLSDIKWDVTTDDGDSFSELSVQMKQARLQEMFPFVAPHVIEEILPTCRAQFGECVDQLLNLAFLHEYIQDQELVETPVPRSVDGFATDELVEKRRKGRRGRKARTNDSSRTNSPASVQASGIHTPSNPWNSTETSLDFLSKHTNQSRETTRKAYLDAGRDLSATIKTLALQKTDDFSDMDRVDLPTQVQIVDLKHEFMDIPERQIYGLLKIARSPNAAYELAASSLDGRDETMYGKRVDLVHYAPVKFTDGASDTLPTTTSPWLQADPLHLHNGATARSQAADRAFSQATSASRRAKSDHLMAGAASYYASEGRQQAQAARELRAAAADAHVNTRATPDSVDLHGTSVQDAVRIAKASTQSWWESLGDAKYASGGGGPARSGFHIVTGIGRHSKDGAPRIGPAVGRALIKEGWKVAINQGEISIYGKIRR